MANVRGGLRGKQKGFKWEWEGTYESNGDGYNKNRLYTHMELFILFIKNK